MSIFEEIDVDLNEIKQYYNSQLQQQNTDDDEMITIMNRIKNCENEKFTSLRLNGDFLKEVPLVLSNFYWLTELYIENTNIKTLTNLPPELKSLSVSNNNIRSLDCSSLPKSLVTFTFRNNKTFDITGLNEEIKEIDLTENNFNRIGCEIPNSVENLILSKNRFLIELPKLGSNIISLDISSTGITNIDDLPDNIQYLNVSNCIIKKIEHLPSMLKKMNANSCELKTLECDFPPNLYELDMYSNKLKKIPKLNDFMTFVDLGKNDLEEIPNLPLSFSRIDLRNNSKLNNAMLDDLKREYLKESSNEPLLENEILIDNNTSESSTTQNYFANNNHSDSNNDDISLFWDFPRPKYKKKKEVTDMSYSKKNPHYIIPKKMYTL